MRKNIGKYIAIILGIICVILAITLIYIKVSSVNAQSDNKDLKSKITEEISYLDSNITETMNKLNNIEIIKYKVYTKKINDPSSNSNEKEGEQSSSNQTSEGGSSSEGSSSSSRESSSGSGSSSQEGSQGNMTMISEIVPNTTLESNQGEVDWKEISFLMENLYSSWPTVNLDLQKQGISSELITSFSLSMDGAIQSIKNKDKDNALINLFNMYINLPKYLSSINVDSYTLNLYNTKLYMLNAYVLVSTGDKWNEITSCISNAKSSFSVIVSSSENDEKKKNYLQKSYVIIEDLERMSQINDKDIFYMGYKNVMQELETM